MRTRKRLDKLEIYSTKGEWFWRRTAANGEIVGRSHEGFKNRAHALRNFKRQGEPAETCGDQKRTVTPG